MDPERESPQFGDRSAPRSRKDAAETHPPEITNQERLRETKTLPPSDTTPRDELTLDGNIGPLPYQFGRYRVEKLLGRGGMGAVYLAHDAKLDRHVALKVPHLSFTNREYLERFDRETRAAATVQHPNLCPIHDVGEIDGVHYLTMGYIEGESLSERVKRGQPFSLQDAAELVRKTALALHEAHLAGVIHRDLKPANIMLDKRGEPIVMDFGLARRGTSDDMQITRPGAFLGTPAYMPPEQVSGNLEAIGPHTDVYSLGATLFELLTGKLPYQGELVQIVARIVNGELTRPSELRADLDAELEGICLKAMAPTPHDRFASMAEFAEALQEWRTGFELGSLLRQEISKTPWAPGCKHDLFVSYAELDDAPAPGQKQGWVSGLIRNLAWRTRQLCGRGDAFSIMMNPELARNVDLTLDTMNNLQETATLLIVLSPAYLESGWCGPEGERFFQLLEQRLDAGAGVFVVERDRVEPPRRPPQLASVRSHLFWEDVGDRGAKILGDPSPDPDRDADYYCKLDDLAREIHAALHQFSQQASAAEPAETSAPAVPCEPSSPANIFLAEVTDDLDFLRDEVKRYLDQHGFRVLPETWYPRDPHDFQQAAAADLEDCLLFAQLLGPVAGKRPPGSTRSYGALQGACAEKANTPVLQWRDPQLELGTVADPDQQELLRATSVEAIDLEDFKREIVQRAQHEQQLRAAPAEMARDQAFVFVNVEPSDTQIAQGLCDLLEDRGYSYALRLHDGEPEEIREDLEANLLDCDGLIVVYGAIAESWVREQLRQWRKVLYRRDKPLRALSVLEAPPPEKPALGMKLPRMQVIDCRNGLQQEKVLAFLQALVE